MAASERTASRRPACGFTLLEILLVLAVLAIGAALVLPALVRPSGTELRTATDGVAAALRRARDAAVSTQRPASLSVDLAARQLRVSGESGYRQLPARIALSLFTARSQLEDERRGRIDFFPDGSSTGGRVTLRIGERHYHVDVDWLTGQVRVHGEGSGTGSAPDSGHVQAGS